MHSVIAMKLKWARSTSWSFRRQKPPIGILWKFLVIVYFTGNRPFFAHKRFIRLRVGVWRWMSWMRTRWWSFYSLEESKIFGGEVESEGASINNQKGYFQSALAMNFLLSPSIIERVKETRTCVKATDEHFISDVTTSFVLMMICVRRTCKFCLHRIKSSEREKQKMFAMEKKCFHNLRRRRCSPSKI